MLWNVPESSCKLDSTRQTQSSHSERESVREGGMEMSNTPEALLPYMLVRVLFREILLFSIPEAASQTQSSILTISACPIFSEVVLPA